MEEALSGEDGRLLRTPKLLLTASEVEAAVQELLAEEAFVIDIETTMGRPRNNVLRWVGLGTSGKNYLIPCGHPKGYLLRREHKEKMAAALLYPPPDERGVTKTGKPSMRMVEYTVPAEYTPPPKQLYPHEVCDIISPLMFSDRAKVGHGVKFDLQSLAKYYAHTIPPGPYHDTIILTHVLDENKTSYGLKELSGDWFGIPHKQRPTWYPPLGEKGTDNFGIDTVARYLAKDLRYCWWRFKRFFPLLERRGVQSVYDFEMSVYGAIMATEYEGFPVDTGKLDGVRGILQTRIMEIERECWIKAGDQFPLSNTDAKRWILFGEGKPVYGSSKVRLITENNAIISRTDQGTPQVTKEVLDELDSRGSKMALLLREWSAMEKLRGTFIEGLQGHLHYNRMSLPTIHTSFKQHGTVTGRLSSVDPNLQQLPRGNVIRSMFVAGEGCVLIVADYDQIELRCAAWASQDPEMMRVFMEGQDIHALAAATMLSIDLEAVTKDQRQLGKVQNFGTLYGAGPAKIAAVAGVSVKRAEGFIRNYFNTFQGLEDWKAEELRKARKRGDSRDPLRLPPYVDIPPNGRRRRLPDLYHVDFGPMKRAERQAINAYVQGFASNITKMAMMGLHTRLADYPAWMVAQVHDEIVVKVDKHYAEEVKVLVEDTMGGVSVDGEPILGNVPLLASAAIGYSWAEAKG